MIFDDMSLCGQSDSERQDPDLWLGFVLHSPNKKPSIVGGDLAEILP